MKLSKTQQELFDAMKAGVVVHYMPYMGTFNPTAYYFRNDTNKRCTAAAKALLDHRIVEIYERDAAGHKLRAKSPESL